MQKVMQILRNLSDLKIKEEDNSEMNIKKESGVILVVNEVTGDFVMGDFNGDEKTWEMMDEVLEIIIKCGGKGGPRNISKKYKENKNV